MSDLDIGMNQRLAKPFVWDDARQFDRALFGTTLVTSDKTYTLAFITMIAFACIGLIAALLLPSDQVQSGTAIETGEVGGKA